MIGPGGGGGPSNDDRLPPMNSQLALRVAIVGSLALLMFAVIFLRLWFLQVLTGDQYVAQAKTNVTRKLPVAAPRGAILASDGTTKLVDSVEKPAILVEPQELPVSLVANKYGVNDPPADQRVYRLLGKALNLDTTPKTCKYTVTIQNTAGKFVPKQFSPKLAEIPCIVAQHNADINTGTITIATNVPVVEQAFISEHQAQFVGVEVTQVSVSEYPQGTLAAQMLGTIGANSDAATGGRLFKSVPAYDNVGQTGLEYQYNKYLQGKDGKQRVEVNAQGMFEGEATPVAPTAGYNLKTSINLNLEKVGTQSLAKSIETNGGNDGGAFVAMNPDTGQIEAMGSLPSYDPSVFTKPLTQQQYDKQFADNPQAPLFDRATQAVGPDGSTFKVITGTAALESGAWTPDKLFDDTGSVTESGQVFQNAPGDGAQGPINMAEAIEVSDDDFFYTMGALMNPNPSTEPHGAAPQEWARKFGIGQRPNIDLPDASSGTVPSPDLINSEIKAEKECDTATGEYSYTNGKGGISSKKLPGYHRSPTHSAGGCGIASADTLGWTIGDNMIAGIGQGDVQASPLQVAMVYSAIANGGTLVSPHIGEDIQTADGQVVQRINPKPERELNISASTLSTIRSGLEGAANGPKGTSTDVMSSFPLTVYGKTGTADYIPTTGPDAGTDTAYAWYACYVPRTETKKPLAVVVWVEDGGYGDVAAAPVARQILSQWYTGSPGAFVHGTSTDQ